MSEKKFYLLLQQVEHKAPDEAIVFLFYLWNQSLSSHCLSRSIIITLLHIFLSSGK